MTICNDTFGNLNGLLSFIGNQGIDTPDNLKRNDPNFRTPVPQQVHSVAISVITQTHSDLDIFGEGFSYNVNRHLFTPVDFHELET